MEKFNIEYLDHFLAAIRKYMYLRGPYSQKELAELVDAGVSTISRFLNKKTTELNEQLIAAIVAKLNIPFSEFIDFVDEHYEAEFKRLVNFKKTGGAPPVAGEVKDATTNNRVDQVNKKIDHSLAPKTNSSQGGQTSSKESEIKEKLKGLSLRQRKFLEDFIALGIDERDLIVDVAEKMMVYFKDRAL